MKKNRFKDFIKKIRGVFVKIGGKIAAFFGSKALKATGKGIVLALPWLILLIGISQVVFGVLVYKFKSEARPVVAAAKAIPYPVAVVNGNIVTYNDYLHEKNYIHHFYDKTQQTDINFDEIDKQVLSQLVENELIDLEAWKYKVSVKPADVDKTVNAIAEQNGGQDKVEKVLSDLYGLDLKAFKRLVKTQLLRDKVNQEVITHVTAHHILIRVDKDAPADKVNEAKTKIDDLYNQVKGGADFADVAKKNSEDVGSNEQGGLLEPYTRNVMVEEFSNVAFSTPVGEISQPVRSDFGWHIIKVEAKSGKVDEKFSDWLEKIKTQSLVIKLI